MREVSCFGVVCRCAHPESFFSLVFRKLLRGILIKFTVSVQLGTELNLETFRGQKVKYDNGKHRQKSGDICPSSSLYLTQVFGNFVADRKLQQTTDRLTTKIKVHIRAINTPIEKEPNGERQAGNRPNELCTTGKLTLTRNNKTRRT